MPKTPQILCPAGEEQHPVLSPNPLDVECRIAGRLRPATGSDGEVVVCCANYVDCKIWRTHKENNWAARTAKVAGAQRSRANHTLTDDRGRERDRVRTRATI